MIGHTSLSSCIKCVPPPHTHASPRTNAHVRALANTIEIEKVSVSKAQIEGQKNQKTKDDLPIIEQKFILLGKMEGGTEENRMMATV